MTVLGQRSLVWSLGIALLLALMLPGAAQSDQGYAGARACAKCHADVHHQWAASGHGKMVQPATEQRVEADFALGRVVLHGSTYLLRYRNGSYFITESDAAGKQWERRVDYTLGSQRIQQYIATLPDGRMILLPAAWDNVRKKWVHDLDVHNPEETPGDQVQLWNKTCFSCHVSGGQKNFDLERRRYRTTWQDFGVNCERCHGPGAEHAAKAAAAKTMDAKTRAVIRAAIVNPARLDAARSSMICAQCHSSRDIYVDGFRAGANYYDYFAPVMQYRLPPSDDPSYWVDGRTRWFANDAFGLWQSECFLKGGATCVTCHSQPHRTNVDVTSRVCTRCHSGLAARISAHTHHASNSAGSSCIGCHMPATVTGIGAHIRDHSMSIPVPENTIGYGVPNACNLCHKDKDAEWTLRQMNTWYGSKSREKLIRRADAFSKAQKGDPAAIPALLQILSDPSGGPLIRANAAGYLGNFPNDPAAYDEVLHSFADAEPVVRATAVLSIRPRAAQREAAAPRMVSLLKDDVATVRMNAAIALVAMGVRQLPGEDGERLERAKGLYRARAELDSDDAGQQFAAGKFFLLSGDLDTAVAALRATLQLDPSIPAQYYLAAALAQKGDYQAAREVLHSIVRNDPQYDPAQRLLAQIDLQDRVTGQNGDSAKALFLEGQLQYRNADYGPALKAFEKALQLAPQADWATQARFSRAICLQKLAHTSEAEAAFEALSTDASARTDVDLQLAYVELLDETGRPQEALERTGALIAAVPEAPLAHFWRAKLLLQLHRTGEAAGAAEESIRLQPELAAAHNLLIRIYQMQGRAREAAEQAQWLRDYQRRMESR